MPSPSPSWPGCSRCWSPAVRVGGVATAREMLLAERGRVLRRIAALEREFTGIAEAASAGGTDDEHDPEGATLAFERQHTAALLDPVRGRVGLAARRAPYSARRAVAVRVLAAQPAGPSAPATAMARPARASRTS